MTNYQPLDAGRNEIRVISLHPETSQDSLIECTLRHVSLNEYSDEYKIFLDLDGARRPYTHQALLWSLITNRTPFSDWVRDDAPPGSLIKDIVAGFSQSPVYKEDRFRNAARYLWGDFAALSYKWGSIDVTDDIVVDGVSTPITKNLRHALQVLRSWNRAGLKGKPVYYWVDALCINQADIAERNVQVQRMCEIYSSARMVLIMTGNAIKEEQAVSELLDQWHKRLLRKARRTDDNGIQPLPGQYQAAWQGIFEIVCRSYWSRLWVIQEILLANSAFMFYGNKFCLLSVFFDVVSYLASCRGSAQYPVSTLRVRHIINLKCLIYLQGLKHEGRLHERLLALLDTAYKAKQHDARDKVYGLLGLMEGRIQVQPDYRLPLFEVYRNFVEEVIKATGALSIIYQRASCRITVPSWPSWVPDWSAKTTQRKSESFAAVTYDETSAAGDSVHKYIIPDNPNHLYCEGFIVDTVRQLGCTGVPNIEHDVHDRCSLSLEDPRTSAYGDSAAVRQGFWNVLTLNWSVITGEKAKEMLPRLPHSESRGKDHIFFSVLSQFQQCNGELIVAQQPLISHFLPSSQTLSESSDISVISKAGDDLLGPMLFRRFMVTEKERLGMVPRHAKLGDAIFILQGCNAPLILRPAGGGTYSVLGECCVDGIMHGEAMEDLAAGRYQVRKVVLC